MISACLLTHLRLQTKRIWCSRFSSRWAPGMPSRTCLSASAPRTAESSTSSSVEIASQRDRDRDSEREREREMRERDEMRERNRGGKGGGERDERSSCTCSDLKCDDEIPPSTCARALSLDPHTERGCHVACVFCVQTPTSTGMRTDHSSTRAASFAMTHRAKCARSAFV